MRARKRVVPLTRYRVQWSNGIAFVIHCRSIRRARRVAKSLKAFSHTRVVDVVELPALRRRRG
jgi:hypothetical protein